MDSRELERRIKALGFESQADFARALGVQPSTVSRWLKGDMSITSERAEEIRKLQPRIGQEQAYADFLALLAREQAAKAPPATAPIGTLTTAASTHPSPGQTSGSTPPPSAPTSTATAAGAPTPSPAPAVAPEATTTQSPPAVAQSPGSSSASDSSRATWIISLAALAISLTALVSALRRGDDSPQSPESAYRARYVDHAASAPAPITGIPMPPRPLRGQARPPCNDRAGEAVINGGCWAGPFEGMQPPCPPELYEYSNKCWRAVAESRKPQPNSEAADGGTPESEFSPDWQDGLPAAPPPPFRRDD